ncbi:hypothetical protein [Mycobacteroides chelonae]|uniref:hypothetical protein n=1 Tax=Mycobacteroides chelonae TaxID=1774 RepID=UPI0018B0D589|nr:hypothetical protein [Mycobacteroides chelonae]MBF9328492.1 hypothetical protein [Mycobacteroides chelonae]MBF9422670.1 hypothetical protein [Mycobacteroides chelonae]
MASRSGRKANTTDRGLGWRHQQAVAQLLRRLVEGSLCWWCGLPMFKNHNKHRNWDGKQLAGDHSVPRVRGGHLADRLLHGTCNSQRQDGRWDDIRPAVQGIHPSQWSPKGMVVQPPADTTNLAMDW